MRTEISEAAGREAYVIAGGGFAALEAARELRRHDAACGITMISGENHQPYNRPRLSALIATGEPLEKLLLVPEDFYETNNIDLRCGQKVESVDAAAKTVTLEDGGRIPYTKLLLATGSQPFNPIARPEGAVPVKTLRCYEDALELANLARGRRVVLVGGGILGLEAAESLLKLDAKVTVVEFAPRILPLQADEAVSAMLAERLRELGVALICGHSVTEATAAGARLDDGNVLEADLVLASMGVRSELALARQLGLDIGRGIIVDGFMRTSLPGIFAAGDCAEYDGRVRATAGAAQAMGKVAGAVMAGDVAAPYVPFVPATIFNMPGFSMFSAGDVSDGWQEDMTRRSADGGMYRRLFFRDGALCGALYVGPAPMGRVMQALPAGMGPQQAAELLL